MAFFILTKAGVSGPHATAEAAAEHHPDEVHDVAAGWAATEEIVRESFCAIAPHLRDGLVETTAPEMLGVMLLVLLDEHMIGGTMARAHVAGARDLLQSVVYFLDRFDPSPLEGDPPTGEMAVIAREPDYRTIGVPGGTSLIDRIADAQRAEGGPVAAPMPEVGSIYLNVGDEVGMRNWGRVRVDRILERFGGPYVECWLLDANGGRGCPGGAPLDTFVRCFKKLPDSPMAVTDGGVPSDADPDSDAPCRPRRPDYDTWITSRAPATDGKAYMREHHPEVYATYLRAEIARVEAGGDHEPWMTREETIAKLRKDLTMLEPQPVEVGPAAVPNVGAEVGVAPGLRNIATTIAAVTEAARWAESLSASPSDEDLLAAHALPSDEFIQRARTGLHMARVAAFLAGVELGQKGGA